MPSPQGEGSAEGELGSRGCLSLLAAAVLLRPCHRGAPRTIAQLIDIAALAKALPEPPDKTPFPGECATHDTTAYCAVNIGSSLFGGMDVVASLPPAHTLAPPETPRST